MPRSYQIEGPGFEPSPATPSLLNNCSLSVNHMPAPVQDSGGEEGPNPHPPKRKNWAYDMMPQVKGAMEKDEALGKNIQVRRRLP